MLSQDELKKIAAEADRRLGRYVRNDQHDDDNTKSTIAIRSLLAHIAVMSEWNEVIRAADYAKEGK